MKVTINVETKTFVRFLVVVSAFCATVFFAWQLWAALLIIAVAVFLAVALSRPVNAIAPRMPGNSRAAATGIAYLLLLAPIIAFGYVAVPVIIDQTLIFIDTLPYYAARLGDQTGFIAGMIDRYNLQEQIDQFVVSIQSYATNAMQGIGATVVGGVTAFFAGLVAFITVLVLTFLMLIEGPRWVDRAWNLYTDAEKLERHQRLLAKMYRVVSGYVNGQMLVATITAVVGTVGILILTYFFNVPTSVVLPLAAILFITDLIPLIGATVGAIIILLVLALNDPAAAIAFLVGYLIYQQIENNFIQPLVQSRTTALSALTVLIAVIIGVTLLGIVGALLAVPLAGCIKVLLEDYMEHRKSKPHPHRHRLARIAAGSAEKS